MLGQNFIVSKRRHVNFSITEGIKKDDIVLHIQSGKVEAVVTGANARGFIEALEQLTNLAQDI